jgi:hypothetical protein
MHLSASFVRAAALSVSAGEWNAAMLFGGRTDVPKYIEPFWWRLCCAVRAHGQMSYYPVLDEIFGNDRRSPAGKSPRTARERKQRGTVHQRKLGRDKAFRRSKLESAKDTSDVSALLR